MKAYFFAGLAVVNSAQAQMLEQPSSPTLQAQTPAAQVFGKLVQPGARAYLRNETANDPDGLHPDYRTDAKLIGGIDLTPNLGIEAGLSNLYSRGFHYVLEGDAAGRAGAMGSNGVASYLAAKATAPVGERFSAYGKLGIASSMRNASEKGQTLTDIDAGPYAAVGAHYKLSEKASLSTEYQRQGDTGKKWGNDTNANGVSAKLKLGF
jgi:hypothetical protein